MRPVSAPLTAGPRTDAARAAYPAAPPPRGSLRSAALPLAAALAAGLALALAGVAGCGGGGGGGSGGRGGAAGAAGGGSAAGSLVSAPAGLQGSATNQAQWQTALAALAGWPAPDPIGLAPAPVAAYNDLVSRTWPAALPMLAAALDPALQQLKGIGGGGVSILDIHSVRLDLGAPPALAVSGPATRPQVDLLLPAPPGAWRIDLTAEVGGTVRFHLFGQLQSIHVRAAVEVTARDIRVRQPAAFDLTDPLRPALPLGAVGAPVVQMQLDVRSPDPIVSTVLGALQQVLDPAVRAALVVGAGVAQGELLQALATVPQGAAWGVGGPAPAPAPVAPLEALAVGVSDDLSRDHMPFDQVLISVFDTPHQGGQVVGYRHHGDSALWTGNTLGAEAFRWDVTGDPRALRMVERIVSGIDLMLEIAPTRDGLLSRTAVPLHSPHVAGIQSSSQFFVGQAYGTAYGGVGAVSRDSYTGVMFGLTQTYHRVPPARAAAGPLIEKAVHYLESHDWIAYRHDGQTISVMFFQSPVQIVAMSRSAALVNPARWSVVADRYAPLAGFFWLADWVSARDVHEAYFKFSLAHLNLTTLLTLETDASRYRQAVASLRLLRDTVGHHRNAYFDTVWAMAVPPEAAAIRPVIEDSLHRWQLRPRRGFTTRNSQDPSVQKTTVTIAVPNHTGSPTAPPHIAPRTYEVAVYPLPVEKRMPSSYVWSDSPFDLDGAEDPHEQHQGVDLILPYWQARSHGVIR